jgi:hypothetical protein
VERPLMSSGSDRAELTAEGPGGAALSPSLSVALDQVQVKKNRSTSAVTSPASGSPFPFASL